MRIGEYFREPGANPQAPSDRPTSETVTVGHEPRYRSQAPPIEGSPQGDVLLPVVRSGVEMIAADIRSIRAVAAVAITTPAEAHELSELRAKARRGYRQLEEWQKKALEPVKERDKAIRACFKPLLTALDGFEDRAKKTALAWVKEEEARAERERRAAQKKQEEAAQRETAAEAAGDEAAAAEASHEQAVAEVAVAASRLPAKTLQGDTGTSYITKRWTFEVVVEANVPREFCASDPKKLRAAVAAGARQIAGVSISEVEDMPVRLRS